MDITVIVPSRGRQRQLVTVLSSMHLLQSGKHQVTYAVACDADDVATVKTCEWLAKELPLVFNVAPRADSLGSLTNKMAELVPGQVYAQLGDDLLGVTPLWDEKIVDAVEKTPHGVFWWNNAWPLGVFYAIVTEKWRQAAGGIFTDHYPFWFDDLCLVELWMMTTDSDPISIPEIFIVDRPKNTIRMRDLVFWQDFFTATRALRLKQSFEIAKKLNLPEPILGDAIAERIFTSLQRQDPAMLRQIEDCQGEKTPPDMAYLRAKIRAEKILATLV